jgi:hypothetical protein
MTATALPANTYVTGTQTKTATSNGALGTIDGVTIAVGDRIWDKSAATGLERGLFYVTSIGGASSKWTMKRSWDADTSHDFVDGKLITTGDEGSTLGGQPFLLTNVTSTFVLDTTTPAIIAVAAGVTITKICAWVRYVAPIAADLISVSAAAALSANGARTLIANSISFPSKLQVRYTKGTNNITAGTIALVGTAPDGSAQTETISLICAASTTFKSTKVYATLASATVAALAGAGGSGDNLGIGVAVDLGLPVPAGATNFVVSKEGVSASGNAAKPTDETVGTVDTTAFSVAPTTAADGAKCFDFWYSYTI